MSKQELEHTEPVVLTPVSYNDCPTLSHGNTVFAVRVKGYHTKEQLEDPHLWSFCAAKFEKFSRLEIHALDGSMFARALVTYAMGTVVRVKVLDHYDLDKVEQNEVKLAGYIIRNLGQADGWSIVHEESGELLKQNMPDQPSCINYLQDQMRADAA